MITQISLALRNNSEGQLRVVASFPPSQFEGYNLQETPHVEHYTTQGTNTHCFRLLNRANARTRKLSAKNAVYFRPEYFDLQNVTEQLDAIRWEAEFNESVVNGSIVRLITIDFDKEKFLSADRTSKKEVRKIQGTSAEKISKGFPPDSAWGQDIQNMVDTRIKNVIKNSVINQYAFRPQQTLVLPNITYNVPTGLPLLTPINIGGSK